MAKVSPNFEEKIRPPAVAGQFYPGEKKELESMIDKLISQAEVPEIEGEIFGLLLPHAGYVFSGQVIAFGLKAIRGKIFDTVIIIGDSHTEHFQGVSIWPAGSWETPLGEVEVDKELAGKILSFSERFIVRDSAHLFEHSVEVEIPFLQKTLKDFKILPIIFGSQDKDWKNLAKAILNNIKRKKILIIASSDLSHYPPYQEAKKADLEILKAVLEVNPEVLKEKIQKLEKKNIPNAQTFLCAQDSVKTLLEIAKNLRAKAKLLNYANSGDLQEGDKFHVVGYGAVGFYLPEKISLKKDSLSSAEKLELLFIARTSVESFIRERKIPKFEVKSERLKENQGAFVTLKKHGKLRGCIGQIAQDMPLYKVVSQMAIAGAVQDPRFSPVREEELPELKYEISVLSPFRLINSPEEIQLGVHGVQVRIGTKSALFLPQVAIENNWDLKTFLDQLMLKAGLWPGYWKQNPVKFYVFEAEVFSEE